MHALSIATFVLLSAAVTAPAVGYVVPRISPSDASTNIITRLSSTRAAIQCLQQKLLRLLVHLTAFPRLLLPLLQAPQRRHPRRQLLLMETTAMTTTTMIPMTVMMAMMTTQLLPLLFQRPLSPLRETPTTSSSSAEATPTGSVDSSTGSSEVFTGGHATYFTQNGVAGACGTVHSDNDFIVAIDQDRYGDSGETSQYCGKTVTITGLGKTMQATVADDCPTCDNENSLDMSVALFQSFTSLDVGEFDS
ncbi:expansin family protein [Lentinula edodes]|uniref:Expansin family protein n=1 Tax=Lentinula edodes TaxID=5353 RepID=A0A1Q3ESG4_LENED|nr:expansin family protein [Lentinula edodes]